MIEKLDADELDALVIPALSVNSDFIAIANIGNAMDTDMHPAAGLPVRIAIRVPPTACPVVPPGSGTLNIIPRNENAAPIPSNGIFALGISVLILLIEYPHTGSMAAVITAHVDGLK